MPRAFYLVACLYIVIIAVMAGGTMTRTDPPVDPFADYADVFPGNPQPIGWTCGDDYNVWDSSAFYCSRRLDYPPVYWVAVSGHNGLIERTSFGVRLRFGDLVYLFNRPNTMTRTAVTVALEWERVTAYATVRRRAGLRMTTIIRYVSLRD